MRKPEVHAVVAPSTDLAGAVEALGLAPGESIAILRAEDYVQMLLAHEVMCTRIAWATAVSSRAAPTRN